MSEAIFGLVGVVIGGALTGGIDYLARRREERQTARALARAIHAHRVEMRSQCAYCAELGDWFARRRTLVLPSASGRRMSSSWAGCFPGSSGLAYKPFARSQVGVRRLARLSVSEQPALKQTHLPTLTSATIEAEAIDHVLPDFEQLSGRG